MNPLLKVDFYKPHHNKMYPKFMTNLYSNFTPRKSRFENINNVVFFGLQHFVLEYLIKDFDDNFFFTKQRKESLDYEMAGGTQWSKIFNSEQAKKDMIDEYKRHVNIDDTSHIERLWDLGYLPIKLKALDEGTISPIGVPVLTIQISDKHSHSGEFGWLVNYLETLMSCMLWQAITSATLAHEFKKNFIKYAKLTGVPLDLVQWQGHDFSMRGMSSVESAILSGMGHLTSFTGTDTIPAIYQLEKSYYATGLIGKSVPASEHSIQCMGTKEGELQTFERLLDLYPTGILSIVSDTWNLWTVLTEFLPALKNKISSRNGKLVIRPDSGDPVDIICGIPTVKVSEEEFNEFFSGRFAKLPKGITDKTKHTVITDGKTYNYVTGVQYVQSGLYEPVDGKHNYKNESKGVVELLGEVFGYTLTKKGFKVLPSYINFIYGDAINLERQVQILERLMAKGWAMDGVLGIGSFTYQHNTRDSLGFAMKATNGEIYEVTGYDDDGNPLDSNGNISKLESREIFKDPITSDGEKKSKKGLLRVDYNEEGVITCYDQQTKEQEETGLLTTVFEDGKLIKKVTLEEIRAKINSYPI